MLGGFLTSVIWVLFIKSHTLDLYEMVPAFIVGMVLTLLVSQWTAEKDGIPG